MVPASLSEGESPDAAARGDGARARSTIAPLVREMLRRIRCQYDGPLTLRKVAADLERQPEYLGWLFRKGTGRTFHERLTAVRLRQAARRIRDGEKIDAVGLLVGYRSKRNFYEQFHRRFHVTPAGYRNSRPGPSARRAGARRPETGGVWGSERTPG